MRFITNKSTQYIGVLFYIFSILHTLSYTTAILYGITLDYERAVFGLLLILLFFKYLDTKIIIYNILLLYIYIVSSFFSTYIGEHISEALGFILYYNVMYIYWKYLHTKYSNPAELLPRIYMFSALPLLVYLVPLLLNPQYISLDFYTNPILETLGLKSRTIGWSAACALPLIFYWSKSQNLKKVFSMFLALVLIILVIGSGSRSSILGVSIFIVLTVLKSDIRYKIYWAFLSVIFAIIILSKSDDLSLTRRAELQAKGVSDDSFRMNLATAVVNHIGEDFPESLFPGGAGYENIQVTLNKFFTTRGFGTHNTYITLFLAFGILSIVFFKGMVSGFFYLYKNNQFINYIPFIIISFTEDCFGPGQLLFPILITIMIVPKK